LTTVILGFTVPTFTITARNEEKSLMKTYTWVCATLLVAATFVLGGCKKDTQQQVTVNPAPLESSFQTADASTKSTADKAVAALKAGNYTEALTELKTLASNAKLTPEQQQAVKDMMAQVQKAIAGGVANVQAEGTKALDNVKQALPK
jgi:uncharacterized lipoprotein YajG